jgi:hypothetical protein
LLETASLYTVQTRYITFENDVENVLEKYKIPISNYQVIGFTTLRDYLSNLKKDQDYEDLVTELKNTDDTASNWLKLQTDFKTQLVAKFGTDRFAKDKNGEVILSSLGKDMFKDFGASEVLMLYEYASHVETKLKTKNEEKEMLLLAGRFAVFIKTNELKELLVEHKGF